VDHRDSGPPWTGSVADRRSSLELYRRELRSTDARPSSLSVHVAHPAFFLLTTPAERCLFLLPHRCAMDVAPSFSHAMEPQRSPHPTNNSPPLQSAVATTPPSLPVMAAMKAPITAPLAIPGRPCLPPDPIKGHPHSGGAPHPFTSPPPLLNCARAVAASSQSPAAGAPPPRRHPSSGEWSPVRATSCPSHRHPRGKPPWPRVAATPSSDEPLLSATVESTGEPWTGHPCAVQGLVDLVHGFFFSKTIPGNSNFWYFALRPLIFSNINPLSLILQLGPWNLKNNSKKVPSLRKIHKNSPKLQNSIYFQP
jgi:hypothetical protein